MYYVYMYFTVLLLDYIATITTIILHYILTGVDDFSPESPLPITLELNISSDPMCVRIVIVNDSIAEGEESFTLELTVNSQRTEPGIVNIPPTQSRAVVNIRETCYNGEIRLRGGYNVNQGRVEICFNGVWGTVCDAGNGWTDGGTINARVVCRQLGLPSTSKLRYFDASDLIQATVHYIIVYTVVEQVL